jgi:hypothetical protein
VTTQDTHQDTHSFIRAEALAAEYQAREDSPMDGPAPAMTDEQYAAAFAGTAADEMAFFVALRSIHERADLLHDRAEFSNGELDSLLSAGLRREDPFEGRTTSHEALYLGVLAYEAIRRFALAAAPTIHHCNACKRHGCYGCQHV